MRKIIRSEMPDAIEGMRYGGPIYTQAGGPMLCGFTAQKNNLAFYVGRVPEELRVPMKAAGFSLGKGAIRFKKLDPKKVEMPRALLREVLAKGITC